MKYLMFWAALAAASTALAQQDASAHRQPIAAAAHAKTEPDMSPGPAPVAESSDDAARGQAQQDASSPPEPIPAGAPEQAQPPAARRPAAATAARGPMQPGASTPLESFPAAHEQTQPRPASAVTAAHDQALRNPLAILRLEDLATTRDRPLFSPSRRPPPAVAEAAPPPPPPPAEEKAVAAEPPPFDLVGSVMGQAYNLVLVRNRATNEVTRLREGEEKDGWRVGTVSLRSASLERDGRVEMLAFPTPAAPAAIAAPMLAGPGPNGDIPEPGSGLAPPQEEAPPPPPVLDPQAQAQAPDVRRQMKRLRFK